MEILKMKRVRSAYRTEAVPARTRPEGQGGQVNPSPRVKKLERAGTVRQSAAVLTATRRTTDANSDRRSPAAIPASRDTQAKRITGRRDAAVNPFGAQLDNRARATEHVRASLDLPEIWGHGSFPASDPPANW